MNFIFLLVISIIANFTGAQSLEISKFSKRDFELPDDFVCKYESIDIALNDCFVDYGKMNQETIIDMCENFETNCKSPMKKLIYYNDCYKNPKDENEFQAILRIYLMMMNYICKYNENGEICPYSEFLQRVFDDSIVNYDFPQMLNENCKSKSCTKNFLSFFKDFEAFEITSKELNVTFFENKEKVKPEGQNQNQNQNKTYFEIMNEYLNSEKCMKQSNAFQIPIKIGNSLLISIGLLLFALV